MFYNYNNYLGQRVMAILLGFSVYNTLQHLVFLTAILNDI